MFKLLVYFLLLVSVSLYGQPVVESATQSSGSGTSSTVDMPGTRPDGDLYYLIGCKDDASVAFTIPTPAADHWRLETDFPLSGSVRITIWHWVGASEPASYTITHDSEITEFTVLHISNSEPNNINWTFINENGNGANAVMNHYNTVVANQLVIGAICVDRDAVTAAATSTGPATLVDRGVGGGGGANDVGFGTVTGVNASAGDPHTDTPAWTHADDEFLQYYIDIYEAGSIWGKGVYGIFDYQEILGQDELNIDEVIGVTK